MESKLTKVGLFLLSALLGSAMLFTGACIGTEANGGSMSVSELITNPVYDTEVKIEGEVSFLGELFCPCFELTSGGETVMVWYSLMVEDDGTERPSVSVEGIENGDQVIVTGELKCEGKHHSLNDFWAKSIEKTG